MAISRPLLFVLIGAVALLAVVMGMRVMGGGQAEEPQASAPTSAPTAATPSGQSSTNTPASRPARSRQPAAAKRAAEKAKGSDPQTPVLRAIAQRKVVVLFFGQYRGADDRATRRAVRAVGRRRDVAVFADSINDVSDYPRVASGLGIQQSPSTAVIDRQGRARVVEGFLDEGSLSQLVADARS
jgi:hypothetical protein